MNTTAATFPPISTSTILWITIPMLLLLLGLLLLLLLCSPVMSFLPLLYSKLLHALSLSPSRATGWKLPLPPGVTGWPYIGKTFRFCPKNPNTFFTPRTVVDVSCGLLLGMLGFWGFTRLELPPAGGKDGLVPFDLKLCFFPFLICSTTGALLVLFLVDSAKHHFAFFVPTSSAIHHGRLLATLGCSGLIHLLVPENCEAIESGPAGFEVTLFLLTLCFMGGLMLVLFGASANLGDIVSFQSRGRRADEEGVMLGSDEGSRASASPLRSIQAVQILVALNCAGLLHLLVPCTESSSGSIEAEHALHVIFLFLSLMASLVMVFLMISA